MEPAAAALRALIEERTPRVRPASARRVSALDPEPTYLQHLPAIERIAASVARRTHLTADEAAEFVQVVRVRLFENDYQIIRKFEGRSSFSTYLTTVILRLFHQWRVEQWGKWRPSAKARALGDTAIVLERLLSRDGFSFPELPGDDSAEERVRAGERETALRSAVAGLDRAMGDFSPEDRLILQLRFWSGRTVPEIARTIGLEPRKVYTRLERSFKTLRRVLEDAGIDRATVGELLDRPALDPSLEPQPERTSTPESASGRNADGSNGARR